MGATDVSELKEEVMELRISLKDIAKQYHEMKHDHANMAQGVVNTQKTLNRLEPIVDKMFEKIVGDEKFNNLGIIQMLKNQEKFNDEIHRRVTDIEQVNKVDEKIDLYKKNIARILWGSIGASFIWVLEKAITYFFHI